MGVIDTIRRSKGDLIKPHDKSFRDYSIQAKLLPISTIRKKDFHLPFESRALRHELSEAEPSREVIILKNRKKSLGRFTTKQVKEILSDLGFNVDPWFSKSHHSDFEAVLNIGGYRIPGWVRIARTLSKLLPSKEKVLLFKLSPGKDRLHIRVFEGNDGTWMIVAHTDYNWISLNLFKVYKSHLRSGSGDYITGTIMMYDLLNKFAECLKTNKVIRQKDIDAVIKLAYKKSVALKLRELKRNR